MSAGHNHTAMGDSDAELDALLTPQVYDRLRYPVHDDNGYDVPYLAGYSKDGRTIYFDRHLPTRITIEVQRQTHSFDPRQFLRLHEELEKALIDLYGFGYMKAHRAATAYERRGLTRAFGAQAWRPYDHELRPYIKADEHERLVKVPPDLDMTPYNASPVNQALLKAIRLAQGKGLKADKAEAEYVGEGRKDQHCGWTPDWPTGACVHFEQPRSCDQVEGMISPRGACRFWRGQQ